MRRTRRQALTFTSFTSLTLFSSFAPVALALAMLTCASATLARPTGLAQSSRAAWRPSSHQLLRLPSDPGSDGDSNPIAETQADAPHGLRTFEQTDLPNGLRLLVGTPLRPAFFTEMLLVVRAGSGTTADGDDEIARAAAELLLSGHRTPDAADVRVELARLGVSVDTTVGRDVAVFRFAAPPAATERLLTLLADLLTRTPRDADWDDAAARRLQALQREEADAWQQATTLLTDSLWHWPPRDTEAAATAGGTGAARAPLAIASIASPDPRDEFRRRMYVPGRMVLAVWGPAPAAQIARVARSELSRLRASSVIAPMTGLEPTVPDSALPEPSPAVTVTGAGQVQCLQQDGASPPALIMGVSADVRGARAFQAWQIAAHILGANYNARLQRRLREASQAVYTIEAASQPVGARGLVLRVACQTERVATVRAIVQEELRRITVEPVLQEEIDLAAALLRSRLALDRASLREQFYRRALRHLTPESLHAGATGEMAMTPFTPQELRDVLRDSIRSDEASTVLVSERAEPLCEARHETKP